MRALEKFLSAKARVDVSKMAQKSVFYRSIHVVGGK